MDMKTKQNAYQIYTKNYSVLHNEEISREEEVLNQHA